MYVNCLAKSVLISVPHAARAAIAPGGWIVTQEIRCQDTTGSEVLLSVQFDPSAPQYQTAVDAAEAAERSAA